MVGIYYGVIIMKYIRQPQHKALVAALLPPLHTWAPSSFVWVASQFAKISIDVHLPQGFVLRAGTQRSADTAYFPATSAQALFVVPVLCCSIRVRQREMAQCPGACVRTTC